MVPRAAQEQRTVVEVTERSHSPERRDEENEMQPLTNWEWTILSLQVSGGTCLLGLQRVRHRKREFSWKAAHSLRERTCDRRQEMDFAALHEGGRDRLSPLYS